ncbi:MSH6 [Cordylochernes scorpioides]|uniref:MSH6 n=1 Tax=Cordylochernes scorpioides TaxID=51811 RepID=A0ABY6K3V5_9ARAC|nr:MSH6 [Cordylochernes scorpioides]
MPSNLAKGAAGERIHSQGCSATADDHPDSRAIFYEMDKYSKRKINDFITVLQGFTLAQDLVNKQLPSFSSGLLQQGIVEQFPDFTEQLEFFRNAFDHEKAKKDGKIIPSKGVDEEYDKAQEDIKTLKKQLDKYLEEQREVFKNRQISYYGSGRNRFQLEVPEAACHRATDDHDLQGQRKGFRRYWTEDIKSMLAELTSAEDHQEIAMKDIMRRIFEIFDKDYSRWEKAISCLATLDCLISMAQYTATSTVPMCRPQVVAAADKMAHYCFVLFYHFKEIKTVAKTKINKNWRIPPKHSWYILGAIVPQASKAHKPNTFADIPVTQPKRMMHSPCTERPLVGPSRPPLRSGSMGLTIHHRRLREFIGKVADRALSFGLS